MSHGRPVTATQREFVAFIKAYQVAQGAPPTFREMAARFGITPRAVLDRVVILERKGLLRRTGKRQSRNVRVV